MKSFSLSDPKLAAAGGRTAEAEGGRAWAAEAAGWQGQAESTQCHSRGGA